MWCGRPSVIALSIVNSPLLMPRARFPWQVQEWVMALESKAAPTGFCLDRARKSIHASAFACPSIALLLEA